VNTVGARKEFKRKRIYDDNYFIREKGGRSRGSIVYQRENVERRCHSVKVNRIGVFGSRGAERRRRVVRERGMEIHVISTSTSIAVVIIFIQ